MSEEQIEKEIQEKNLNAPRLTPALIDSKVKEVDYHVFPGSCLTVCCMTLANGFTVTGESACASPENFNAEIGEKIAFENARNKIWALEGYLLKQKLHETPVDFIGRLNAEQAELREKLDKLVAYIDTDKFNGLGEVDQELLRSQSDAMHQYLAIVDHRVELYTPCNSAK
tara:strand:- start:5505 stop:6014 length:510 start_codon:yes stop_codon:yes gene_type:complete